jgi:MHS family proline/betaine transporter-like MFS transporter
VNTEKEKSTSFYNLLKIGLLANAFEWYEFAVFNYLSITIGQLFFKADQPIIELLRVFSLFAMSHLIRPIGSLTFGLIGDRLGRRYALNLSLILMTVPTVLIGLLPTYEQIGVIATFALMLLRLVQGFAMGGELPATACYVFETAESRYKSFLCSAVGAAPKIGLLWGSLTTYLLMQAFDEKALLDWGWRIPFLLGVPITFFIAYIRRNIQETADFSNLQLKTTARSIWGNMRLDAMMQPLIQGLLICVFLNVGYPVLTSWMPFYLHKFLEVPLRRAQLINTLALCVMIPLCLSAGYLSKRFGYRRLLVINIIATLILIIPLFKGLQMGASHFGVLLALQIVFAGLTSISQGLFFEMVNRLFEPEHRSLGVSLVSTLPAALIAGTVPFVCSYVIYKTGWLLFPAVYILISGLVALPATLKLKDMATNDAVVLK